MVVYRLSTSFNIAFQVVTIVINMLSIICKVNNFPPHSTSITIENAVKNHVICYGLLICVNACND